MSLEQQIENINRILSIGGPFVEPASVAIAVRELLLYLEQQERDKSVEGAAVTRPVLLTPETKGKSQS
jgi:hypothetical protein